MARVLGDSPGMLRTLRSSPVLVIAAVIVLVGMVGTATAATKVLIKNSAQVKNGSLEAADLSAKARKSLRGAAGPAGPAGAAGAPGPAGARGPSEAFFARPAGMNSAHCPAGGCAPGTTLRTLTLPAGSYLVTGSAEIAPATFVAGASRSLECHLVRGDTEALQRTLNAYTAPSSAGGTSEHTVAVSWALTLPAETTVSLNCSIGALAFNAYNAGITALRVGTLTETPS